MSNLFILCSFFSSVVFPSSFRLPSFHPPSLSSYYTRIRTVRYSRRVSLFFAGGRIMEEPVHSDLGRCPFYDMLEIIPGVIKFIVMPIAFQIEGKGTFFAGAITGVMTMTFATIVLFMHPEFRKNNDALQKDKTASQLYKHSQPIGGQATSSVPRVQVITALFIWYMHCGLIKMNIYDNSPLLCFVGNLMKSWMGLQNLTNDDISFLGELIGYSGSICVHIITIIEQYRELLSNVHASIEENEFERKKMEIARAGCFSVHNPYGDLVLSEKASSGGSHGSGDRGSSAPIATSTSMATSSSLPQSVLIATSISTATSAASLDNKERELVGYIPYFEHLALLQLVAKEKVTNFKQLHNWLETLNLVYLMPLLQQQQVVSMELVSHIEHEDLLQWGVDANVCRFMMKEIHAMKKDE